MCFDEDGGVAEVVYSISLVGSLLSHKVADRQCARQETVSDKAHFDDDNK